MKRAVALLAALLVLLAPFLVSPYLRSSMGEMLMGLGYHLFSREFVREFGHMMVAMFATLALVFSIVWLNLKAGDPELEGWQKSVFIPASLVLFFAVSGLWVWGLVGVASVDWVSLSPKEQSGAAMLMTLLFVVGLVMIVLARAAIRSVRLLIKR